MELYIILVSLILVLLLFNIYKDKFPGAFFALVGLILIIGSLGVFTNNIDIDSNDDIIHIDKTTLDHIYITETSSNDVFDNFIGLVMALCGIYVFMVGVFKED